MLKIKNFFIIPIIFLFLPACVIFLGATSYIRLIQFILPLFALIAVLLLYKSFFINLRMLYNKSPMIYFILLIMWSIFVSLLAVVFHYYSFVSFTIYGFLQIFFRIVLLYIFPILIVPAIFSIKDIVKILYSAFFIIFIIGITEFIAAQLHIEPLSAAIQLISNILPDDKAVIVAKHSGLARIRSVFSEPGEFAQFIAITMPLIYCLSQTKYKIYNNFVTNFVIKKMMIPLMFLCLILTQSPIYIIICAIVTLSYYAKDIIKLMLQHKLIFISLFTGLLLLLIILQNTMDIEKTPLIRIANVLSVLQGFSIEKLFIAEPSLATRICSYINLFCIFLKHPIIGIGFGNCEHIVMQQLLHSPVMLPREIYLKMTTNRILLNSNAMYLLLHQTGIIGYGLYSLFMIKTIIFLNKLAKYFYGIEYNFIVSLGKTILAIYLISSIYNLTIFNPYLWFYTGLTCTIYLIAKKKD